MARPRKDASTLSKSAIFRAALILIQEGGEEGVTFRALAKALDVTPMAVSYHVGSRKALLAQLISDAFQGVDAPAEGGEAADRLRALMLRYCRLAMDHSALITVMLRDPLMMGPELTGFTDRVRAETRLLNGGDAGDVLLNLVIDYAHGFIFAMASAPPEYDLGEDDFLRSLDWVLGKVDGAAG